MHSDVEREALLAVFAAEAEEHLNALDESLDALGRAPARREALDAAFRAAHSLKGSASIVGFPGVTELAHRIEDALEQRRDGRPAAETALLSVVRQGVVALRQAVQFALRADASVPQGCAHCLAAFVGRAEHTATGSADQAAARPAEATPARTLRVPVQRLDRLLDLAGELTLAQADLRQALGDENAGLGVAGRETLQRIERLHALLQEQIMSARLVPLGPAFQRQVATLRELAAAHGKLVSIVTTGGDVEVDTTLGERLFDPLMHLLRNAVDHGIETPDARRAAGKDPCGRVSLRARHEGGGVVIEVADDGAGMDLPALRSRAQELGMEGSETLADADACALAFEAGLTTAREVTGLSGRGVGLDAVRRGIESLRGSIGVETRPGAGTTFTLRLPLALAIIEGFGLGVGDESYVVPLDNVIECMDLPADAAERDEPAGVIDLRGVPLPFLRLRVLFGVAGAVPRREQVVVLRDGEGRAGLAVDRLLGASQTVVKPLTGLLRDVPGITGTAILGAGRVALTLDTTRLLAEARGRAPVAAGA